MFNLLKNIKKIIIIIGCQRSGTTLLGQIMGAAENAVLLDEPDGFYQWFPLYIGNEEASEILFNKVLEKAKDKYINQQQRIIKSSKGFTLGANIHYLILKAPNLTYHFKLIASLNIPVFVIYIVRDPRAVVASMMNLSHINFIGNQLKFLGQHSDLMVKFKTEIKMMSDQNQPLYLRFAYLHKIKSNLSQYFIDLKIPLFLTNYETLIANTSQTCQKICQQAKVPFDQLMLAHETVYQGYGPGKTRRTRAIDNHSSCKWKKMLTQEQEQQILTVSNYHND